MVALSEGTGKTGCWRVKEKFNGRLAKNMKVLSQMAKEMDKAPTFLQMEGNGLVSGVTICKMDLDAINSSTGKPLKVSG